MTITPLKPVFVKPERIATPQCCIVVDAPPHSKDWRLQRYAKMRPHFAPELCQHESSFQIDGKHYCKAHAGQIVMKKWIDGELVEVNKEQLK